jgi:hypothetical protein
MLKDRSDTNLTPTQANNGEHGRQQSKRNMLIAEIFEFFTCTWDSWQRVRSLDEGTKVSYEVTRGKKGIRRTPSPPSKKQTPLSGTRRRLGLFGTPAQGHKAHPGAREKL